ncbi:MAG: phage major capsid protein [Nocardioidaceae bacterium]
MSDKLKSLLDKRARAWSEAQDIRKRISDADDDATLSGDEQRTYEAALDDVERFSAAIETEERAERIGKVMAVPEDRAPVPSETAEESETGGAYDRAFGTYLRVGMAGCDSEERALLAPGADNSKEVRALAGGSGSTGGYLIPTTTLNKMTETMKAYGGLLGFANVIDTASGNVLQWPTNNDTSNVGAILADNTQIGEQDAAFGQNTLGAYTYTSRLMRCPWSLLEDSIFNLESFLARKAGQRIGRAVSAHLVTGTGTSQPHGLFTGATSAVTFASTTAVTYDELLDLQHSVDPAYRYSDQGCMWALSDQALKAIRKLKDNQGRPLWQPSVQAGEPSLLLGDPYVVDQGIAVPGAAAVSIGYGDIDAAFTIRRVAGGSMVTLRERYADYLQNGYFAFMRFDSVLDDASAFKTGTQAAA